MARGTLINVIRDPDGDSIEVHRFDDRVVLLTCESGDTAAGERDQAAAVSLAEADVWHLIGALAEAMEEEE